MSSISKATLAFLVCSLLLLSTGVRAFPQSGDEEPQRRDNTMGTPGSQGGIRIGTDENGDNVMQAQPEKKDQQGVPSIGPIFVTPEIDQRGRGPVPSRPPYGPGQRPPQQGPGIRPPAPGEYPGDHPRQNPGRP